jgi:hypothetical protein
MKSYGFHTPQSTEFKTAGIGLGALLGLAFNQLSKVIPGLAALRETHPVMYDAALGAAIMGTAQALEEQKLRQNMTAGPVVNPPPWSM